VRKSLLAAGTVAAVLLLGACGMQKGAASAAGPQSTGGSAGLSSPFTNANQLVAAAKEGTNKSKSAKFTMRANLLGQSVKSTGQGRFDGANSAMAMTIDTSMGQMEMRLVDKTVYMKLPGAQAAQLGNGKPWLEIDSNGDAPASKVLSGSLSAAEQNDPSKTLEQIKSEQTTLNGEPVNHYTLDLDFAKTAGQLPGGLSDQAMGSLKGKNVHIPMELWLNAEQLPVQIVMDMGPLMQAAGTPTQGGDSKMTVTYSDWGTPVDVQAPPADQVGSLSQVVPTPTR